MTIGLGFLIYIHIFVQKAYSEPDQHVHVFIPPEDQGEKISFHLSTSKPGGPTPMSFGKSWDIVRVVQEILTDLKNL